MLNKLTAFIHQYDMIHPGDRVICAVSGGADSVALLFGLYLLKDKLNITLEAAHFNHHLRGAESDRDQAFVEALCDRFDIPLHLGEGWVKPGKKGLEAAARDARYAFLRSLTGKIATAHTADDDAETVLMHLVRGTGLKGLCGIAPVGNGLIRPLLRVTRADVEAFLEDYCLGYMTDSSNDTDQFLRNRLRHRVLPLLKAENPQLAENLTAMALSLRQDAQLLEDLAAEQYTSCVSRLREMPASLRGRCLERLLKQNGVREPERCHIELAESLVFSDNPSARAAFPGGVTVERRYDTLCLAEKADVLVDTLLAVPGVTELPGFRITCCPAQSINHTADTFTVKPSGPVILRSRRAGDEIRLPGGTKSLKKLYIDRKIPQSQRDLVPVIADDEGVIAVCGIGVNKDRITQQLPAVQFTIEIMGG